MTFGEFRFGVERIDLGHASVKKNVNHVLGTGQMMRWFGLRGQPDRGLSQVGNQVVLADQTSQGQCAETCSAATK